MLIGGREIGEALVDSHAVALVSATGSTRMGRQVGPRVAQRFGRVLLELGGNNAIIVGPSADLDMAARGIVFGAIGTAGQRCTSTRRLIVHDSVADELLRRLRQAYASAPIGNPLDAGTLVGPLIDRASYDAMQSALKAAVEQGGKVTGGERALAEQYPDAWYVRPAIAEMPGQTDVVCHETFAPILYVIRYTDFAQALALNNAVPQGLSSAIFTNDLREAETFLSASGSDCGIANVNIGTSGAEIGGAFGGEKETGGGRESGSDAWRNTCAAPPTPSTTRASCRWPRASSSANRDGAPAGPALFQCLHKHRRTYRRLRRAMLHCFVFLTSSSPMSIDRPIHALHVLSAALALGMAGTATAGVSYRLDRPRPPPATPSPSRRSTSTKAMPAPPGRRRPSWCCSGAARTARSCAAWRACRAGRRATACPSTTSRAWPGRPRCPPARAGCRPFPSKANPP